MNSPVTKLLDTQPTVFFFYLGVKSGPQDDGTLPTPVVIAISPLRESPIIGTLSMDDDDGSENVDKKMNLPFFKLNRVYLDALSMSNADDFSWD